MSDWKGKSRGNTYGYMFFITMVRWFGLYPAYFFLFFIAGWFYFFATKDSSKWMYDFFHNRIGFGKWKSKWKIYVNYVFLGQVLIDKVAVLGGMSKKFSSTSNGAENLHRIAALNKGAILLGAHLGNWEIAGQYLLNYSGKINIVMYDGEDQQIKELLQKVMGGIRYNVIAIKNDLAHIYAVSDALARNEIVVMHADRFVKGARTVKVPFLGEEAQFPIGPFQLIKTFRANYTFVYGIKASATHYNFYARPHREGKSDSDITEMVKDYANDLEQMVKQHPEQWFNFYNFWTK
jgi:predicted LPLAT superfamily acyltransferase